MLGDRHSAFALIQQLVKDNAEVTLALQQQMADEKKTLEDTDAGQELHAELIKQRKQFEESLEEAMEEMEEALRTQDQESEQMLKEVQEDFNERIRQLEQSKNSLKIDMETLHRQQSVALEAKMQAAQNRHDVQLQAMESRRASNEAKLVAERQEAERQHREMTTRFNNLQIQRNNSPPAPPAIPHAIPGIHACPGFPYPPPGVAYARPGFPYPPPGGPHFRPGFPGPPPPAFYYYDDSD